LAISELFGGETDRRARGGEERAGKGTVCAAAPCPRRSVAPSPAWEHAPTVAGRHSLEANPTTTFRLHTLWLMAWDGARRGRIRAPVRDSPNPGSGLFASHPKWYTLAW
jgi:hypothetical protein